MLEQLFLRQSIFLHRKLNVYLFQHQLKWSSFDFIQQCLETLPNSESNDYLQNYLGTILRLGPYSSAIDDGACLQRFPNILPVWLERISGFQQVFPRYWGPCDREVNATDLNNYGNSCQDEKRNPELNLCLQWQLIFLRFTKFSS